MTTAHREDDGRRDPLPRKGWRTLENPTLDKVRWITELVIFSAGAGYSVFLFLKGQPMWAVGVMAWACVTLTLAVRLHITSRRLKEERSRSGRPESTGKRKFHRFEDISRRKVIAGTLEYYPLLLFTGAVKEPSGIAVALLNKVLGEGSWKPARQRCTWESLGRVFKESDCDLIATPVYETHKRTESVAFSSPVFYADIGIYVRPDNSDLQLGIGSVERSFKDAIELLKSAGGTLKTQVIRGELSEKLVDKHIEPSKENVTKFSRVDTSLVDLIAALVDYPRDIDYVFAERLIADETEYVRSGEVVNILKPGELIYPVGFAIRPQEYVLRHFINLRLLEIDEREKDGMLGFLVRAFNDVRPDRAEPLDLHTGAKYFIRSTQRKEPPGAPPIEFPNRPRREA